MLHSDRLPASDTEDVLSICSTVSKRYGLELSLNDGSKVEAQFMVLEGGVSWHA